MPAASRASSDRALLTLAHSADADDLVMWWPITGQVSPDGSVVRPPVLDTGRLAFRAVPDDIERLNRRAQAFAHNGPSGGPSGGPSASPAAGASAGDGHDITAISFHTYAHVRDRYTLLATGSSMGEGYGPKVVAKADTPLHSDDCLRRERPTFAVPGTQTTAFLTLSLMLRDGAPDPEAARPRYVVMPFDRVLGAVQAGRVADQRVDAGVVIHEGQVTFADQGLKLVVDLGAWWARHTGGLPLPLGANAARRDLDARFGPGTLAEVQRLLHASVLHALEHIEESMDYAERFAAECGRPISRERLITYLKMYVTPLSVHMGQRGRDAVRRLLREGAAAGLCPEPGAVDVVGV